VAAFPHSHEVAALGETLEGIPAGISLRTYDENFPVFPGVVPPATSYCASSFFSFNPRRHPFGGLAEEKLPSSFSSCRITYRAATTALPFGRRHRRKVWWRVASVFLMVVSAVSKGALFYFPTPLFGAVSYVEGRILL